MPIPGNLMTTAMAVIPHTDVDQDREKTVEKAFQLTRAMSETLREEYKLI